MGNRSIRGYGVQSVDLLIICRLEMPNFPGQAGCRISRLADRFLFRGISQFHVVDLHMGSSAR